MARGSDTGDLAGTAGPRGDARSRPMTPQPTLRHVGPAFNFPDAARNSRRACRGERKPRPAPPGIGRDRAVVGLRAMGAADPVWGLEAVLAHQPLDTLLGGANALVAESGPDLAVALAVERRLGQHAANMVDQFLIRTGAERTSLPGLRSLVDRDGAGADVGTRARGASGVTGSARGQCASRSFNSLGMRASSLPRASVE